MTNVIDVDKQAIDLIARTKRWLFNTKNPHWTSNKWVETENIPDLAKEDIVRSNWSTESETCWCYECQEENYKDCTRKPLNRKNVLSACALGGLLVNNNFEDNEVYERAAEMLHDLVDETAKKTGADFYRYDNLGPDLDQWEENIIRFNDKNESSHVKTLFELTVNRFRRLKK